MKHAFAIILVAVACQGSERARPAPAGSAAPPVAQPNQTPEAVGARAMPPPLPSPLPGARKDITKLVGTPVRVAILDRQVVLADATRLRVIDTNGREVASAALDTGVQVLVAGEHGELYVGTGMSREHHDAKARVAMYKVAGAGFVDETIVAPTTERNEVVAILPGPEDVLVAYYDSKYMVTSLLAKRASVGWQTTPLAQLRMATSYARGDLDGDGKPELVVGRVYGDAKGVDGDAFVLKDTLRTPIPTTRGVRSLAIAGGDLFVGDGWHQNYAQLGHGLLTQVRHTPTGFRSLLVEDSPGQYAIEKILPARINGKPVLVTLGSHFVRVYSYDANKWKALTIAGAASDIAVGDLDGEAGDEIVIAGKTTEVVSLVDVL